MSICGGADFPDSLSALLDRHVCLIAAFIVHGTKLICQLMFLEDTPVTFCLGVWAETRRGRL
jgi:hypothetical protein